MSDLRNVGRSGLQISVVGLGCNNFGMKLDRDESLAVVDAAFEAGIRMFGTDHIDLYYQHHFDPHTPLEETLSALDQLVRQGKVRYVGSSNFAGWQVTNAATSSRTPPPGGRPLPGDDARGRGHPRRDRHRSRHRVVSQPPLRGVQGRFRHRTGVVAAVPVAGEAAVGTGLRRPSDGRVRGRRRPCRPGTDRRRGRSGRTGSRLHAGQGPRSGGRRQDPAVRSTQTADDRPGRGDRTFRCPTGMDPGLPRARGGHRRRVPRSGRLGGEVGGHGAGPLRPDRGHPVRLPRLGHHRSRCLEAGAHTEEPPGRRLPLLAALVAGCVESDGVEALRWAGPSDEAEVLTTEVDDPALLERVRKLPGTRS